MSDTWGPRAHPERCNDEQDRQRRMKTGEQILTVIMVFCVVMAAVVWLTWKWAW